MKWFGLSNLSKRPKFDLYALPENIDYFRQTEILIRTKAI